MSYRFVKSLSVSTGLALLILSPAMAQNATRGAMEASNELAERTFKDAGVGQNVTVRQVCSDQFINIFTHSRNGKLYIEGSNRQITESDPGYIGKNCYIPSGLADDDRANLHRQVVNLLENESKLGGRMGDVNAGSVKVALRIRNANKKTAFLTLCVPRGSQRMNWVGQGLDYPVYAKIDAASGGLSASDITVIDSSKLVATYMYPNARQTVVRHAQGLSIRIHPEGGADEQTVQAFGWTDGNDPQCRDGFDKRIGFERNESVTTFYDNQGHPVAQEVR